MLARHSTLPKYKQNRKSNNGENFKSLKKAHFNKSNTSKNIYNIIIDKNKKSATAGSNNNPSENQKMETSGSKHQSLVHGSQGVKLIVKNEKLPDNSNRIRNSLLEPSLVHSELNIRKKEKIFNIISTNDNNQFSNKKQRETSSLINEKKLDEIKNKKRKNRKKNKDKNKNKKATEDKNTKIKIAQNIQTEEELKRYPVKTTDVPNVNKKLNDTSNNLKSETINQNINNSSDQPNKTKKLSTTIMIAKAINLYLHKEHLSLTYDQHKNKFRLENKLSNQQENTIRFDFKPPKSNVENKQNTSEIRHKTTVKLKTKHDQRGKPCYLVYIEEKDVDATYIVLIQLLKRWNDLARGHKCKYRPKSTLDISTKEILSWIQ